MEKILILSNPRTGSTYLKDLLHYNNCLFFDELIHDNLDQLRYNQYNNVSDTLKNFNQEEFSKKIYSSKSPIKKIKHVDKLLDNISHKNKQKQCIGYKIFLNQLGDFENSNYQKIFSFFDKVIFLNRDFECQIFSEMQAYYYNNYVTLHDRKILNQMNELIIKGKTKNFVKYIYKTNKFLNDLSIKYKGDKFLNFDYKNLNKKKLIENFLNIKLPKTRHPFSPLLYNYSRFFANNSWIKELKCKSITP
jgi:hypothetical protein